MAARAPHESPMAERGAAIRRYTCAQDPHGTDRRVYTMAEVRLSTTRKQLTFVAGELLQRVILFDADEPPAQLLAQVGADLASRNQYQARRKTPRDNTQLPSDPH